MPGHQIVWWWVTAAIAAGHQQRESPLCHSSTCRSSYDNVCSALVLLCGSFSAVVEASGSAWRIDRQAFEQMATKDAFSLALLQQVVLRSTCLSAAHAREALERASHAN